MNALSLLSRILRPLPTQEREPLAATGRAGRNLPAAITTGVVLIAAVGVPLFFAPAVFLAVICLLACGALWELGGAFARLGTHITMPPLYVGAFGMAVCAWTLGAEALLFALYATVFACVAWRILDSEPKGRISDVVSSVFAAAYVPFLASFVLLMLRDFSPWLILVYVALVVASDTGGWAAGVMWGKHPMAPRLSPKKSWEGFIGSAVAAILVGVGCFIAFGGHWAFGVLSGIGACVIGTIGDLTESLIKRETGLKDMSRLLPGHGGLLDRVDALLMVAPFMHLVYSLAF